jgi:RNA polymerase sigma-70 factor (ECF subfamily)
LRIVRFLLLARGGNNAQKRGTNLPIDMSNKEEEKDRLKTDEDNEWVSLCQKGDVDAFEALVKKYQKKVLNVAYRMIGNYDEACEVAQEAFFSAYKAIRKFRGESKFSTWLYSIAINHAKNHMRQIATRYQREGTPIDESVEIGDGQSRGRVPAHEFPVVEEVEKREVQAKVQEGINLLDAEYREVLVLRDIQGFSYEEIGVILKVPGGTVKSRLFRARDALKGHLKKAFGDL